MNAQTRKMRRDKEQEVLVGENTFDTYEALRRLHTGGSDLLIQTIPGEEWTLTCKIHKQLLVPVYTLSGTIAGTRDVQSYRCGRLSEIIIKWLRYGRKVGCYHHHHQQAESNITEYTRRIHAETLEEDLMRRLCSSDIAFDLIPGERWRLTNTCFGKDNFTKMFYFIEDSTLGTPDPHMFKGLDLEHLLFTFLCQKSTWHISQAKMLTFKLREVQS